MLPEIQDILGPALGGASGAVLSAYVAKVAIERYIRKNDEKHRDNDKAIRAVGAKLESISTDIAVIKVTLGEVAALKSQVMADHDKLVELQTWNNKYKDDLTVQFSRLREVQGQMEDVATLISGLRRQAND